MYTNHIVIMWYREEPGVLFQNSKDQQFYQILRSAAENSVEAAQLLNQLLADPAANKNLPAVIKDVEKKGDNLTHDLFGLINKSFVTPLEREDLAAIGVAIDSVVDGIEMAAARFAMFKVTETDRFLKELGATLRAQCGELVATIDLLAGNKLNAIHDQLVKINLLENQADDTLREALSTLYENAAQDPVRFVVMKEIYDTLEDATDKAEDVANTLEGVIMKHA